MQFFLSLILLFSFCYAEEIPTVLVSFAPYKTLVKEIAADTVDIEVMVPPGASAHTYEPSPRQMVSAGKADLWFRIGEPFENRAIKALKSANPKMEIVDLRQGIPLLHSECIHHLYHEECGEDLHIWLSPKLTKIQAATIANALMKRYPANAEMYRTNLQKLNAKFDSLDQFITKTLAPVKNRNLLVSHPAYGYFCEDYHFTQIPIEWEGKDPTAKQLTDLLAKAKSLQIKFIFTQPQYSAKAANLIASKLGIEVIEVDPYSEDIDETLRQIATLIASHE